MARATYLGIQHGNQSSQRLFGIPRSSIAETLIFIVIVTARIAATVMWGCPAGGCGYSGKGRRRHTDTTMYPYLSRCRTRWGRLCQRGRVAGRRPLLEGALGYLLRRLRLRTITSRRCCTGATQRQRAPVTKSATRISHCIRSRRMKSDMHISTRLLRQHIAPGREV
jgi:hypothetical protein